MSEPSLQLAQIKAELIKIALAAGFQQARVAAPSTDGYFEKFQAWVESGQHGDMDFLERNHELRQKPEQLHPGTCRVVSLRYDYLPAESCFSKPLDDPEQANISRYALGKDYHKLMRKKLAQICQQLEQTLNQTFTLDSRVFVDSAPVLETAFAEKSGLGWKGKHSLIINEHAGSWFFLGEIFINLPLPLDPPVKDLCGSCSACIKLCPTDAIKDAKTVDARRCISYLTIENKGPIPVELRALMGNRIYGCDDCQLACPWNRYAEKSTEAGFQVRDNLHQIPLLTLWSWRETDFLENFSGSPIRRIGYQSWLRNLAVAIGNSPFSEFKIEQLEAKKVEADNMVMEHIDWAINMLQSKREQPFDLPRKTVKLSRSVKTMLSRDA